ncbi:hypothetical protein [Roseiflexus sp.]|uniref:hypothetical protein n=1 Tax=Roseiflexus sp. TaxID=2562120 RepID=UPI002585B05D|nr:hypothetical protein [Roseiflexus sp.]
MGTPSRSAGTAAMKPLPICTTRRRRLHPRRWATAWRVAGRDDQSVDRHLAARGKTVAARAKRRPIAAP